MTDYFKEFVKRYNELVALNDKEPIKTADFAPPEAQDDEWYEEYDEQNAEEAYMPESSMPKPTQTTPIKSAFLNVEKAIEDLRELGEDSSVKLLQKDLEKIKLALYEAYRKSSEDKGEWGE